MIKEFKQFLERRNQLSKWKEEKREKWLKEGKNKQEIEKILKLHRISLIKFLKQCIIKLWQ